MAVVRMPDAPSVNATVPNIGGAQYFDAKPGLMEGKVIEQFNQAAAGLNQAVDDAYVQGSQIRAKFAYNELQDKVNELQTNALNELGTQVVNRANNVSFTDYYLGEIKKIKDSVGKGLDKYQLALLDQYSNSFIEDKRLQLYSHQIRQTEAVEKQTAAALASKASDKIAVKAWDAKSVAEAKSELVDNIKVQYRGSPQEFIDMKAGEAFSTSISRYIAIAVDNGETEQARTIFKRYKPEILGNDRKAVESIIRKADLKDNSETKAQSIIGKNIGWAESLKEADKIEDRELREATRTLIDKTFTRQKHIYDLENKDDLKNAFDLYMKGEEIPTSLQEKIRIRNPEGWLRLEKAMKQPNLHPSMSVREYRDNLNTMASSNPEEFANVNLVTYAGVLSKEDFNALQTRQKNLGKGNLEDFIKDVQARINLEKSLKSSENAILNAATKRWARASSIKPGGVVSWQDKEQMLVDLFKDIQAGIGTTRGFEFENDPSKMANEETVWSRNSKGETIKRVVRTTTKEFDIDSYLSPNAEAYIEKRYKIPANKQNPEMKTFISDRLAGRPLIMQDKLVQTAYKQLQEVKKLNPNESNSVITNRELMDQIEHNLGLK